MIYSYFVKKLIRQSFENVNNHNYDELLKAVAPNVHHRALPAPTPLVASVTTKRRCAVG
jgi:hypothetical protein